MAREASFELNCPEYTGSVADIVKLLNSFGWSYYDEDGRAEYLPVGDCGSFDWQMAEMTETQLFEIFDCLCQRGETIGIVMYYRDTEHGITLLSSDTGSIIIIPNICRRTLNDDDDNSITDVSWYAERIVQKLIWYGCKVSGFRFEEFEGQENEEF